MALASLSGELRLEEILAGVGLGEWWRLSGYATESASVEANVW